MSNPRTAYEPAFKKIRPFVIERDDNRCRKCGSSLQLEVHHIDGYKRNDIESLITLCYLCHGVAPMGKIEFQRWLFEGKSGVKLVQEALDNKNLHLEERTIETICSTLVELEIEFQANKLKGGRVSKRAKEGRCEGRKPFGMYPGEAQILADILRQRSGGALFKAIADSLNTNGILGRHGGPWRGPVIAKIVRRHNKQVVSSLTDNLFDG